MKNSVIIQDGDSGVQAQVNSSGRLLVDANLSLGGLTVNAEKDEDTAHASGDTGNFILAVRNDTPGSLVTTDGDYAPFQVDADGNLRITGAITGTVAATQSGTWTVTVDAFPASQTVDQSTHDNLNCNANMQQGDADVAAGNALFVQPGTSATFPTGAEYAEDAAHTTGDTGLQILAVRHDAATSLVSTDGDYAPLQVNAAGRLKTDITSSATLSVDIVDLSFGPLDVNIDSQTSALLVRQDSANWDIDSVIPGTGTTNLGKAEDQVFVTGDVGVMALTVRSDGDTAKGADGDYVPFHTDASGHLKVSVMNDSLTVASAVTSVIPGTGATNLGKAQDAAIASGDTGVAALFQRGDSGSPTINAGTPGDYTIPITDSSSRLWVRPIDGNPANFNCTVRVRDGINGAKFMTVVDQGDGVAALGGGAGPLPMAEVSTSRPTRINDDFEPLSLTTAGLLRVAIYEDLNAAGMVSGESRLYTEPEFTVNEDAAHSSAAVAAYVVTVRDDDLSSSTSADGDYQSFKTDSVGALWTRTAIRMESLSESTDGQPIQISGTATGTANDLHITTASEYDRVTIDITNTSDVAVQVNIEMGGTGTGNEIRKVIPGQDTVRVVADSVIGGSVTARTISAYADTTNVLNAVGYVERNV